MRYQLTLLKNPNGTFSFVGSVPYELAFVSTDGSPITKDAVEEELLLPAKYRKKFKTRVFQSRVAALMIAKELGFSVDDKTEEES